MANANASWASSCVSPNILEWVNVYLLYPYNEDDLDAQVDLSVQKRITQGLDKSLADGLINEYPWLEYLRYGDNIEATLQALRADPNRTTAILREYINSKSQHYLHSFWMAESDSFLDEDTGKRVFLLAPLTINSFREALESLIQMLAGLGGGNKQNFSQRILQLCLAVPLQVSNETHYVFHNLDRLRELAYSSLPGPEAALQKRVDVLTEENEKLRSEKISRGQIISCLAYRRLIEKLCANTNVPNPRGFRYPTTTEKWQQFWQNSMRSAQNNPDHPLAALRSSISTSDLDRNGLQLFGTLSANIHNYPGTEFNIDMDHWTNTVLVGRILQAMHPRENNITHGPNGFEVDYQAEGSLY